MTFSSGVNMKMHHVTPIQCNRVGKWIILREPPCTCSIKQQVSNVWVKFQERIYIMIQKQNKYLQFYIVYSYHFNNIVCLSLCLSCWFCKLPPLLSFKIVELQWWLFKKVTKCQAYSHFTVLVSKHRTRFLNQWMCSKNRYYFKK